MHGLSGDFATMPLKYLVLFLGNQAASGTLALVRDGVRKRIVLKKGVVHHASSNVPREELGQLLINLGLVTEEQFVQAIAAQAETRVSLGRILVLIGLVSEAAFKAALTMKLRETVLEAFTWSEGAFSFEPDTWEEPPDGGVEVSLLDLHREADFRVWAWQQIRAAFPHGSATLTLKREHLVDTPRPGSLDDHICRAIEQGQTLDEMGLRLHATDFFLYNRLYVFFRLGAIVVNQPRTADFDVDIDVQPGLLDVPTTAQLLAQARTLLAQGQVREAFATLRRSSQLGATLDGTLLMNQLEAMWYPKLKSELLVARRIPKLNVAAPQLSRLAASAPERYLLSRVDGRRDVAAIVRVAPLKPFDALAFFDRFAAEAWITWA
jgi:hypothetical protein